MATGARPEVLFAGCPAAQRTANARAGGGVVLLFLKFAIHYNRRSGGIPQRKHLRARRTAIPNVSPRIEDGF